MTFRELIKKYKDGTLSEEEKLLVERELEKNEAINDYLVDEIEKSIGLNSLNNDEGEMFSGNKSHTNDDLTKQIKKTVNRRLASVVGMSLVCMLAIVLIIRYIVSPLVASQYYNPTKMTSGQEYNKDFAFDIKAVTSVSMPGYGISGYTNVQDLGFGEYKIIYNRRNLFTNEEVTVNANIDKNMRVGTFEMFYPRVYTAFSEFWDIEEGSEEYEENMEHKKHFSELDVEYMRELPPTSYISAWVRFPQDLSMKNMYKTMEKFTNVDFKWIAVRTAENQGRQLMGFSTGFNDNSTGETIDDEKYPGFHLVDTMRLIKSRDPYESAMADRYESHFTSLLKYLTDHKEAASALIGNSKHYDYESALKYVEENGMHTFGALVYGEADDLLELYDSGEIMTFHIDSVLASKYNERVFYY